MIITTGGEVMCSCNFRLWFDCHYFMKLRAATTTATNVIVIFSQCISMIVGRGTAPRAGSKNL
jgi:hypothetical protein